MKKLKAKEKYFKNTRKANKMKIKCFGIYLGSD